MSAEQVRAPFTPEQVTSLNDYQRSGVFHPFTCGPCRDSDPNLPLLDEHLLVATEVGWVCPTCDHTQDWAWAFMADGSWHRMKSENWLAAKADKGER